MTTSPSDPKIIIAGIRQFGLAPDGSDLRDLEAAIARMRDALQAAVNWYTPPNDSKTSFPLKQIVEAINDRSS